METRHFVNLTNGLEAAWRGHQMSYVRIQSTACEQHRWSFIIEDLDHNFLMAAALGYECVVHDRTHKGGYSRALWQGLPWIEYVLNRAWYGKIGTPKTRGHDVSAYFNEMYCLLTVAAQRKLAYYKRFAQRGQVNLVGSGGYAEHDGDYEFYVNLANAYAQREDMEARRGEEP